MSAYSLRARWVLPIDGPPIEGGCVSVVDGRILDVGDAASCSRPVEDLGDVILMPGLVNAHTHLEFSDLKTALGRPGMSLPAWIRLVIAERNRGDHDEPAAIAAGLLESSRAGVTTVGEICTAPRKAYEAVGPAPLIVSLQESIGFSSQRVDSAFVDVERRFSQAADPKGLSPHAPYTAHPRLVERICGLAALEKVPVAMHLAESRDELDLLANGGGEFRTLLEERSMWDEGVIRRGSRPLDYIEQLRAGPWALVIHGNYLAADEVALLGTRRATMSVVYCPRTHAYFEHEPYPLATMLKAGVRVALGTDSRASNPDLDLLADLRHAAKVHPQVEPAAWLRMATIDAAAALLGVDRLVGSLSPTKRADLIALPFDSAERNPYSAAVHGSTGVSRVWINGIDVE